MGAKKLKEKAREQGHPSKLGVVLKPDFP